MPTFSGIRTTPPPPRPRRRPRWPEAFERREAAQDAIDLAAFRRIHDETMSAALLGARDAPDEESARASFDRASSQVSAIESTRPGVQQAYARFYEGAQARYADAFARQAAGIKDKQSLQRGKLEVAAAIDRGEEAEAVKLYEYLKVIDPGNIPLYEQGQVDVPFDTLHTFAAKAIDSDDPAQVRQAIEVLQGMDTVNLRAEQLESRHKLLRAGQRELDYRQSQNADALYAGLLKMDVESQSPLEHHKASEELNQAIQKSVKSGAIDPHHAITLQAARRSSDARFERGIAVKTDPVTQGEAEDMLLGISTATSDEEFARTRKWLLDHALELGPSYNEYVKRFNNQRKEPPDSLKAIIDIAMARLNIAPEERAPFIQLIVAKTKGKDLGAAEMFALVAEEEMVWRAAHRAFPPAKLANLLGYLETGTRFIGPMAVLSEIRNRKEAIDLIYQEGWFDVRLRPEERAQIRAVLDVKYAFGDEELPLHPSETGALEPTGGGRLDLRGEPVVPQAGPESLEGWENLTPEQQAELKRRWGQS